MFKWSVKVERVSDPELSRGQGFDDDSEKRPFLTFDPQSSLEAVVTGSEC